MTTSWAWTETVEWHGSDRERDLYRRVEDFVIDAFPAGHHSVLHMQRTAYWLSRIRPDADLALLIAAQAHDIQRAEQRDPLVLDGRVIDMLGNAFLAYHQRRGAELVGDFLRRQGADPALVARVEELVAHHEIGGDRDRDSLKDADSISFLENCADYFVTAVLPARGAEEVRDKLAWMLRRISSATARRLAEPYYRKVLARLAVARDARSEMTAAANPGATPRRKGGKP